VIIISKDGTITDARVTNKLEKLIEKGDMTVMHGIIVHQTGGSTAESSLSSYKSGNAGALILNDKDSMIYQTARLYQSTWHVGKLQARCVAEHTCKPLKKWDPSGNHKTESAKAWPARYPGNSDAIGIELVLVSCFLYVDRNYEFARKWGKFCL
jgi:hypothetical protein